MSLVHGQVNHVSPCLCGPIVAIALLFFVLRAESGSSLLLLVDLHQLDFDGWGPSAHHLRASLISVAVILIREVLIEHLMAR